MRTGLRKSAFTLVELLVVISITSSLLAVLAPAMRKARASAKLAVCASNLHQNYLSLNMYAANYNNYWPKTDYPYHTNQFYSINSPKTNGPLYYLWLAGFVSQPKIWYCPAGQDKFEQSWQKNDRGRWHPIATITGAGYQYRMRLAFYNPVGKGANYNLLHQPKLAGCLRPDNYRDLAVWTDAFGWGDLKRRPNHSVSNIWNVLFNDSSVRKRYDIKKRIPTLDLSWWQGGDYRLPLPNKQADYFHNAALLWYFFDKGNWQCKCKEPF